MTSEEKAALVLADPAALWVVLNAGVKVAGPWARHDDCSLKAGDPASMDPEDRGLARVVERDGCWTLQLEGEWVDREFSSREEAESWADDWLGGEEWLLVDTPA